MESVRTVIRNFIPVFVSRGVVQISAYVDALFASLLPTGALAALVYAQTLYILPVSLFGMSVSAAELPALSSALGEASEVNAYMRSRLNAGLRRIAFFIIPSAMAFSPLVTSLSEQFIRRANLPGGFSLCVGHFGRFCHWSIGHHTGKALCLDVLCIEGYPYPSSLCNRTSSSDCSSGISMCSASAGSHGPEPALGGSGAHRIGGARRMAGVSPAAEFTERTDRQDRCPGFVRLEIMGRRWSWGHRRAGEAK